MTSTKNLSLRETATFKRAAWLLLCYVAKGENREPETFRQWAKKAAAYFEKLKAQGEPNPLDFLTAILSDPAKLHDISAIGIEANSLAVMLYTTSGEVKFLTKYIQSPTTKPVDVIYFPSDLLREIAADLRQVEEDVFSKLN